MEEIIKILETIKPGVDYNKTTNLITDAILTSFDIVSLVPLLNEKFSVEISVMDLLPENFESAQAILNLINKLK